MEAGAFFEMDAPGHAPTFSGRVHSVAGISFLLLPPAAFLIQRSLWSIYHGCTERLRGQILAWLVFATSCLLLLFNGFLVNLGIGGIIVPLRPDRVTR